MSVTNASPWGIDERYEDGLQRWHVITEETKAALLTAMGGKDSRSPQEPPLKIVQVGAAPTLAGNFDLELEDGTQLQPEVSLPPDLPLGYHTLRNLDSGKEGRLIVTPKHCFLREQFRTWGWALQLYALLSQSSWGIGDLEDLRRFSTWSADVLSAGVVMTNPIGATAPVLPQQPSPYFPSSRLFRNPLYLGIEEIPGARSAIDLEHFAERGRALNKLSLIDRDAIYKLKLEALQEIWTHTREHADFSEYEREQGRNLELFAAFCVIGEQKGSDWRRWPEAYRNPRSPQITRFTAGFEDRIRFHKWIQWLLDSQLARASHRENIMQDLPIGVDPEGFDTWLWQDVFANRISVGAPPDPFSASGQNWGLPPFVPHKLRAAAYEPFVQTVRSAMRYSAALRIDHVMGLFRLFWIPFESSPQEGCYVRYRADELLPILALESQRAKAFVVGEDLGTVEPGVREELAKFRVLSYRVMWFEQNRPKQYPSLALAAASTHDLPTIAGVWSRADVREQEQAGLQSNAEGLEKSRRHLKKIANVRESAPISEVVLKAHEALAKAPSAVLVASLDDALCVERRPNLPGTANDTRPNWSIPLPKKLEEIETDPLVLKIAQVLQNR